MSFNPFKQRRISAEKQLRHWAELKFAQKASGSPPKQPVWRNITDILPWLSLFAAGIGSWLLDELT